MSATELEAISATELASCVSRLGAEIAADHPHGVLLVSVLTGSMFFLADLARALEVPCELEFIALSAYAPGETRVRILKDLDVDVSGRPVVVVKDVVDTGLSTRYVVRLLEQRRAASVRVCTLVERPERRIVPVSLDYVGFERGEEFLVGYGLDFAGRYRNLGSIYEIDPEAIVTRTASFEAAIYPSPSYRTPERRG